jgi:hypothetical protein
MPGMTGPAGRKSSSDDHVGFAGERSPSPPPTPSTGRENSAAGVNYEPIGFSSGAATGHRPTQGSGRTGGSGQLHPALLACGCHIVQRNQCLQVMLQDRQVLLGKTAQLRVRAGLRFGLV